MSLFLKLFNTTAEYNAYTADTANFIKPNVSHCIDESEVHYSPNRCEEETIYELVGEPSYPTTIDGASASFNMTFNYKRTDIGIKCSKAITYGSDTVTVEIGTNPSTASSRTVSGTVDYHGTEIEYSITQSKFETKVTAKYNVTSTSSPTQIIGKWSASPFSAIEIDGTVQPSVVSTYTFSTTGEHTVMYTLKNPTSIGERAFNYCSGLTSIDIPSGVTSIGSHAFYSATSLTSIVIPSGVTSIGSDTFSYCKSLSSITIPDGVTSIGDNAFNYCSGLTSIDIPSGVTIINSQTFNNCTSLSSITIPDGVTSIGQSAFHHCKSLSSITIPDGVTSIGNSAFSYCSGLTSCTIGSGVTSIGNDAFTYCSGITSIDIPSGVTSIGASAFYCCSSLTSITVDSNNTTYDSHNDCNAIIETSTNTLLQGCNNTVIPNNITAIGNFAFYHCSELTNVVIPDTVTSIGVQAFYYCSGLTSCTIGSGVTSIDRNAFDSCKSLTSIVSNATTAPTIQSNTFLDVKTGGTLTVPSGSSGYDTWMQNGYYYLGVYSWTKVEQ